jgi:hypothetical protein
MSEPVPLNLAPSFSATDLNKSGGKLLDSALEGPVRITRRDQRFVLIREDEFLGMIDEARDGRPKSLEDLLRDYDAEKIRKLTRPFLEDKPKGKELI